MKQTLILFQTELRRSRYLGSQDDRKFRPLSHHNKKYLSNDENTTGIVGVGEINPGGHKEYWSQNLLLPPSRGWNTRPGEFMEVLYKGSTKEPLSERRGYIPCHVDTQVPEGGGFRPVNGPGCHYYQRR